MINSRLLGGLTQRAYATYFSKLPVVPNFKIGGLHFDLTHIHCFHADLCTDVAKFVVWNGSPTGTRLDSNPIRGTIVRSGTTPVCHR